MKHFSYILFVIVAMTTMTAVDGQTGQLPARLPADQAGCVDSKIFPKLLECRIDNCEKKESDHRDIQIGEDEKGDAVNTLIEGDSRTTMYECREGTTSASIVERAATLFKTEGFEIPYKFADAEASLTAHKGDLWMVVDAASRFYTVTEINAVAPDFESATDASSMADMIERYGHVPVFDIQFLGGRADLTGTSSAILEEVATMLKDHPTWRFRVEGHTDNTGTKTANLNLSFFRATAVVTWLAANGIKRSRLDPQGMGDTKPIGDNATEAGRKRNRRIELVKISAPGQ